MEYNWKYIIKEYKWVILIFSEKINIFLILKFFLDLKFLQLMQFIQFFIFFFYLIKYKIQFYLLKNRYWLSLNCEKLMQYCGSIIYYKLCNEYAENMQDV